MHGTMKPNIVRQVRQRHEGGGFTLIELMIVIVILGVAAAIVIPMASSAASMQIRSAVNMMAADLEYAKSMAIGTGQAHSVVFDAANERYWIVRGYQGADTDAIEHPVKKGFPYVISFASDGRLSQVEIVSTDFNGNGNNIVSFDYLGSPYKGGAIPAALNSGVVTLQAGEAGRTVRVEPVTGFISISD
jgi:prepilin-type N-terminal cleavage/methylation domain-containing protein